MKKIIISMFWIYISVVGKSQNLLPEPEFASVPMYYDEASKTLKNFERPQVNIGARATGLYSGEQYSSIEGITSTVSFDIDHIPFILFKTTSPSEDPMSVLSIIKMQVNDHKGRNQREYILGKAGVGNAKSTVKYLSIEFQKIASGIYKIILPSDISVGEYVMFDPTKNTTSVKVFAFNIRSNKVKTTSTENESIEGRTFIEYKRKQAEISNDPNLSAEEKKRLIRLEHDKQAEMERTRRKGK